MQDGTHEQTINTALGEVLSDLSTSWRIRAERVGRVFEDGGRPDVLIEESGGWPLVVEAEVGNHTQAEADARARLGRRLVGSPKTVESAIALVYREDLRRHTGRALREAIRTAQFEYAAFSRDVDEQIIRFPAEGWLRGSARELALVARRVSVPPSRVEALALALERGVERSEGEFSAAHPLGSRLGIRLAVVLGQHDDEARQSRKMAMTVIVNALVFHATLAEAEMLVRPEDGRQRPLKLPTDFRSHGSFQPTPLLDEWAAILRVNYWPIFHTASELLRALPTRSAVQVLDTLWATAEELVAGGVTKSHDLTGIVFQRLIADRKFLATFYTRPAAAALLAGLALPLDRPLGIENYGDTEALARLRIADFACGTGTLLSTAYQRLSTLLELHGGDARAFHRYMMKHGLVGLDVLNVAVHLTAAMLASSHPDTPFDGDCLLTVPYGPHRWGRSVGSLDLLSTQVPIDYVQAAATTAGGRGQEYVHDLVFRLGHGQFSLVVMNPPFTRHGAREGERQHVHNPAFAAFEMNEQEQDELSAHLRQLARGSCAHGHAGMASYFAELAHRKVANSGTVALVLPMSAMSGQAWEKVRRQWREKYSCIVVVSIAERGTHARSFSADTGMAECLFTATKSSQEGTGPRGNFAILYQQPRTTLEGDLIGQEISTAVSTGRIRRLEDGPIGGTPIRLGTVITGEIVDCPLPAEGAWPVVGASSIYVVQTAFQLTNGRLWIEGMDERAIVRLPVVRVGEICQRIGPHHLDLAGAEIKADGLPQGPFAVEDGCPAGTAYPMLWNHDAAQERRLIVRPDSHGRLRDVAGRVPAGLRQRATARWETASHAHYNTDLQFNAQSLVVATTEQPAIGGRAWPSVVFEAPEHEIIFALWCNSTLGLLCHWWIANTTQAGRGTTTISGVPLIPTLDVRALSRPQREAARRVFDSLMEHRFLPFDQIDEDPARADLDRLLLVEVLGLDPSLCDAGGPIDRLRRQLAAEPQIQGGKRTRVVLTTYGETSEPRADRATADA